MTTHDVTLHHHYLEEVVKDFRNLKKAAEKAFGQLSSEEKFHRALDPESNSIAVLMRHLGGNMISRWTDFLTTDGEKPTRKRDQEFDRDVKPSRDELVEHWERGWTCLFEALDALQPEDLHREVFIRGEEHSVLEAIQRQLTHCATHVGQIVFLAKHLESEKWQSLSIPRGESEKYFRLE